MTSGQRGLYIRHGGVYNVYFCLQTTDVPEHDSDPENSDVDEDEITEEERNLLNIARLASRPGTLEKASLLLVRSPPPKPPPIIPRPNTLDKASAHLVKEPSCTADIETEESELNLSRCSDTSTQSSLSTQSEHDRRVARDGTHTVLSVIGELVTDCKTIKVGNHIQATQGKEVLCFKVLAILDNEHDDHGEGYVLQCQYYSEKLLGPEQSNVPGRVFHYTTRVPRNIWPSQVLSLLPEPKEFKITSKRRYYYWEGLLV